MDTICSESRTRLYRETLNIINKYNVRPKKRLSQNFIIDPDLINTILKLVLKHKCRRVLEVGAGIGTLTKYLARVVEEVIAVEVDKRLATILEDELAPLSNITVINQDFLKMDLSTYDIECIVSNTPFHISSKILFKILNTKFKVAIMSFQKEFAERLKAKPSTRDYSRLTVMVQLLAHVEFHGTYPPTSFYPAPEVDIVIVEILPKPPINIDTRLLEDVLRVMFTQKNKLAYKPLQEYLRMKSLSLDNLVEHLNSQLYDKLFKCRVRDFTPEEFKVLVEAISKCVRGKS